MKKTMAMLLAVLVMGTLAFAQPFQWPAEYAPTAPQGGEVRETSFGDITTLNPVLISSATEQSIIGSLTGGPGLTYRDWLGTRAFRDENGTWNGYFAANVEEVRPDQEFIVTLREGWRWSDGVEMTADDVIAAYTIIGDPAVESNSYVCSVVDDSPVQVEKLGTYQVRITLPAPQVNSLAVKDCGTVPAHIYMPVYEAQGAEGIKALWGVDTNPADMVSGGPYILTEFQQGARMVFVENPLYGESNVQAADGSPIPGPDRWIVTITEDRNQELSLVVTGQASFYWPDTLDRVAAVQNAVQTGAIGGRFYPNIAPSTSSDFITYNFNNTNECKRNMFRSVEWRQAMSMLYDRDAMVEVALGGLGFPAKDYQSPAALPFHHADLPAMEFDPEGAVAILNSLGFTEMGADGVLRNPNTGCRVEFDLQYNSGNTRRAQIALVAAQTAGDYGVRINPREVDTATWSDSIVGTEGVHRVDYDAQIWGLAGGDMDNPASLNVLRLGQNLNAWNKDAENAEPWELLMDRLSQRMSNTLDLDERVEVYKERSELMRDYLPITYLIAQSFHFYENLGNVWPQAGLDPNSIQSPYRPGNYRENLTAPQ